MKKNLKKKIGVATCLFVIITSGLFASTIQHHVVATTTDQTENTENVVVQIMDESYIKEIVVTLTKQKAGDVETAIEAISKRLQTAQTPQELRKISREALCLFQSLGIVTEKMDQDRMLHLFEGEQPAFLSRDTMHPVPLKIKWNALCFIAGDTTNTMFSSIGITLRDRILTFLTSHGLGSLFIFLMTLRWLRDNFTPFSIWHRIYLGRLQIPGGVVPAKGWILTCGLTGLRMWNKSITGNIVKDPWYDSTGVLGFTGIKIMHKELYRSFYLGKAVLVSIM